VKLGLENVRILNIKDVYEKIKEIYEKINQRENIGSIASI